jgi:hypothetical protein
MIVRHGLGAKDIKEEWVEQTRLSILPLRIILHALLPLKAPMRM